MQIADSCLDSSQMGCSGLWSVNREKDHMCDNNWNKECYAVRKVIVCIFEEVSKGVLHGNSGTD